ncbi:MAG: hypothetical protein LBC61_00330 [Candidatus Peribacteria bacterium]|jgi:hypothetical protein|nr:hypothetical protein [Candidatus Peribacteria bacterium]
MPPKSKNNIEVKITALDFNLVELFSLFQHSKNEVENFLKRNISENQTISDFKDRFRDAIKFLEETSILSEIWLYRVPHLENILTNMFLELDKIKNMQDLINFVSSFNSNIETEIKSLLLKIMFCIIDFRSNDSNKQEALLTEIIQIFTETD